MLGGGSKNAQSPLQNPSSGARVSAQFQLTQHAYLYSVVGQQPIIAGFAEAIGKFTFVMLTSHVVHPFQLLANLKPELSRSRAVLVQ